MSQPRDPSEIEDVLAAIRRLVREEHAPAPSTAAADDREKLLLTPALRVTGAEPGDADGPQRRDTGADDVLFLHRPVWTPDGLPPRAEGAPEGASDDALEAEIAQLEALAGMERWADTRADAADALGTGPEATPDGAAPAQSSDPASRAPAGGLPDEAALREIVRDVVREELQGAAGERVARTLQDLVRDEIRRALAERDLR
jgi:hypothetical protein